MSVNQHQQYWNKVANEKTFTHPVDIALLRSYIKNDAAVVDYGCGYGRVVELLNDEGFINVKGYDFSEALIERGKRQGVANIFRINAPRDLPVEDNSVDCILLFAVLTCIPANKQQAELMTVLLSKLKPGGIIYISDYYLQNDTTEVKQYEYLAGDKENFGVFNLPEGATFRHHTKEWITFLLKDFRIKDEMLVEVKTMNGSTAEAFQVIAQK